MLMIKREAVVRQRSIGVKHAWAIELSHYFLILLKEDVIFFFGLFVSEWQVILFLLIFYLLFDLLSTLLYFVHNQLASCIQVQSFAL